MANIEQLMDDATNSLYIGDGWWLSLHIVGDYADSMSESKDAAVAKGMFLFPIDFTKKFFKASECKNHFSDFVEANPPGKAKSYLGWTVDAHNEVNQRNGKPMLSVEQARKAIRGKRDLHKSGCGGWAFIHQTALYVADEPKYLKLVLKIHSLLVNQGVFGNYYAIPRNITAPKFFEWTVKQHSAHGTPLTVEQAMQIWTPENVRTEPCSGPGGSGHSEHDDVEEYEVVSDDDMDFSHEHEHHAASHSDDEHTIMPETVMVPGFGNAFLEFMFRGH